MRVKIKFLVNDDFKFRKHLNEAITAYIYRCIALSSLEYATNLHDKGIKSIGHKKFNYHTFALIQNNKLVTDYLEKGVAELIYSSVKKESIFHFLSGLCKIGKIQLLSHSFNIINIKKEKDVEVTEGIFRVLSPIHMQNKEKTLDENEMTQYLANNLLTKYNVLYDKLPENLDIKIKLLNAQKCIVKFKSSTMISYIGNIAIKADKEIVKLAYDAGVGSKTGCGLGLIEKIK